MNIRIVHDKEKNLSFNTAVLSKRTGKTIVTVFTLFALQVPTVFCPVQRTTVTIFKTLVYEAAHIQNILLSRMSLWFWWVSQYYKQHESDNPHSIYPLPTEQG